MNIVSLRRKWRKISGRPSFDKVDDIKYFNLYAHDLLHKIQKELVPFQEDFYHTTVVTHTKDGLWIQCRDGRIYTVEIDKDTRSIYYLSAVSGRNTYVLNSHTNEWVDPNDGHLLEEKISQDFILPSATVDPALSNAQ